MKRRRGTRDKWIHAGRNSINLQPNAESTSISQLGGWLLPPARTRFMLETTGKSRLITGSCLLWMNYYWALDNTGSDQTTNQQNFPVELYITKSRADSNGFPVQAEASALTFGPFAPPEVPTALTTWELENESQDDGLDPWMWCHHIFELEGLGTTNNAQTTAPGRDIANSNPYTPVYQAFQPNVVVKTRRSLSKEEGIAIVLAAPNFTQAGPAYLSFNFNCAWRYAGHVSSR